MQGWRAGMAAAACCAMLSCGSAAGQPGDAGAEPDAVPSVRLGIKGGTPSTPITVSRFGTETADSAASQVADRLLTQVLKDLESTPRFLVLRERAIPGQTSLPALLDRWAAAGSRAFVAGEIVDRGGSRGLSATLRRLPAGNMVMGSVYPLEDGDLRKAAHRLADDIVFAMSGRSGIARTRIAFVSGKAGAREIHTMDYDGHDPRPLTRDSSIAYSPDWSPDGRWIVYSVLRDGRWELAVVAVATGLARVIATPSAMNTAPAWSPDGEQILFAMQDGENIDLCTVPVVGGDIRRITRDTGVDTEPCWSPDGSRIAFTSDRTGVPQIYVSAADGSDLQRLTWEPDAYEGSPSWSPDGDRIAFVRRGFDGFDVFVAEVQGGTVYRLTSGGSNENPVWSPDGLQIVYSSDRGNGPDLYTVSWDGASPRRLTTGGRSLLPSWSPVPDR